jgi:ElaB/YqjD/DUF883 family membrane-anchored ribosome-binding protein
MDNNNMNKKNREEFAEELMDRTKKVGNNIKDNTQKMARKVNENLEEFAEDAGDQLRKVGKTIQKGTRNAVEKTKETMNRMTNRQDK